MKIIIDNRPNFELKDLPIANSLSEQKMVYNPIRYIQLSGDFSLMQQRVLFGILNHFQLRIIESIRNGKHSDDLIGVFSKNEVDKYMNVQVRLSFSELGVKSNHYKDLLKDIDELMTLHVKRIYVDEKTKETRIAFLNMFSRIDTPSTGLRRNPKDSQSMIPYLAGYMDIYMPIENLREIFSLDKGYVKHFLNIVMVAKKKYTPKMYELLSAFSDRGHLRLSYDTILKEFSVGVEHNKDGEKEIVEVKKSYTQWNEVRRRIIDPVKEEMKRLADEGNLNIYFDYDTVYSDGKNRGNPLALDFNIFKTAKAKSDDAERKKASAIRVFINSMVKWCPDLKRRDLVELLKGLSDDDCQSVIKYGYNTVRNTVEKKQPDDVASYAMAMLRRHKDALLQRKRQQDLFAQAEEREVKKEEPQRPREVAGEYAEEWKQIVSEYDGVLKPYLLRAEHKGSFNGFVCIHFKTQAELDEFNRMEEANKDDCKKLEAIMRKVLGTKGRILVRGVG